MASIINSDLHIDIDNYQNRNNLEATLQMSNITQNAQGPVVHRDGPGLLSVIIRKEYCELMKTKHNFIQSQPQKRPTELIFAIKMFLHEDVSGKGTAVNMPPFNNSSREYESNMTFNDQKKKGVHLPGYSFIQRHEQPDKNETILYKMRTHLQLSREFQHVAHKKIPYFVLVCVPIIDHLPRPDQAIRTEKFTIRSRHSGTANINRKNKKKRTTAAEKTLKKELELLEFKFEDLNEKHGEYSADIEQMILRLEEAQKFLRLCKNDPVSRYVNGKIENALSKTKYKTCYEYGWRDEENPRKKQKISSSSSSSSDE
tara:strand:- start:283 stop:1224 length:942 start_codon:yes stop_codon:yes gene_type:complete